MGADESASRDTPLERPAASPPEAVRPAGLRPLAISVALSAHAAIFIIFAGFLAEKVTPLDDLRVELVQQGETVTETSISPTPDAAPTAAIEPIRSASPDPTLRDDTQITMPKQQPRAEAADLLSAPLPQVEAPDALPLPIAQPRIEDARKSQRRVEEKKRKEKPEVVRRQAAQRIARWESAQSRQLAAHEQAGAAAVRTGVREGAGNAPHMSKAAYAALVSAEIHRHKHYPASARQSGSTGAVGVIFSIGPSGAIVSHSITRSSGNGAIDAAVHEMLATSHPPPPPGGFFHGSVTISFDLDR